LVIGVNQVPFFNWSDSFTCYLSSNSRSQIFASSWAKCKRRM